MLRRLRHKLRMIHYYSAARPQTGWSRALDIAFVASFVLALPMTWLCDAIAVRPMLAIDIPGQLIREQDSSITALLLISRNNRSVSPNVEPVGSFRFQVEDHHHGWPLATSVHRQPARLDLDIRGESKTRMNAQLAADDPLRLAIDRALRDDGQSEGIESQAQVRQQIFSWAIAAGLWWIIMVFAAAIVIRSLRFGSQVIHATSAARRAHWRAQGKCLSCGYDMTGLEFNEKCPECGSLVS